MRVVMLLCLLMIGCGQSQTSEEAKKKAVAQNQDEHKPSPSANPNPLAAIQGVRGAVKRTVTQNELKSLHLYIETAFSASGKMPTTQEIEKEVSAPTGDRKLSAALQDGSVVLTGTRKRESIWAYEKAALTAGGLVVKAEGVQTMTADQLTEALQK